MEIRQAELPDFESVHDLICELALYEKAPAEVITDPEILAQHCLANNPFVFRIDKHTLVAARFRI